MYTSIKNIIENFSDINLTDIKSKIYSQKEYKMEKKYLKETSISRGIGVSELLYQIKFNILENPVCLFCKEKKQNFLSTTDGYTGYCSRLCADKCPLRKQKRKETCIKLFGSESNLVSQRESDKKKWMERYGVDNPTKNKVIADKAVTKTRETLLRTTGYDNSFKNPLVRERLQVKQNEMRTETLEKMKETFMKNYGVDNPWKDKEVREKTQINAELGLCQKYNVSTIEEARSLVQFDKKKQNFEVLKKKYKEIYDVDILSTVDETKEHSFFDPLYSFYCNKCNTEYIASLTSTRDKSYISRCLSCRPLNEGLSEKQIVSFISEFGLNLLRTTRKIISPLELDIYIPEKSLAIEYNGLMFHSIGKSKYSMFDNSDFEESYKGYHLRKTILCQEKGIQLLHVFENEWVDLQKQDIWKSIILENLGLTLFETESSQTTVGIVSYNETKQFLTENHLEGYLEGSINLGLYNFEGELLQMMTFGQDKFSESSEYVMYRECSRKYLSILGGHQKLFQYFIDNYLIEGQSCIAYSNRRYSKGDTLIEIGFQQKDVGEPNYFYFKEAKYQLYSSQELEKSENTIKIEDYRKIYDCGNYVFVYTKTEEK